MIEKNSFISVFSFFDSIILFCFSSTATIASITCYDFDTLAVYSAIFGFTVGAYVALRSVILVDLMGLENLNNAFGLLMWFEGLGNFFHICIPVLPMEQCIS